MIPLNSSFGIHYCSDLTSRQDVIDFLDKAEVMYGPSGKRAEASIGPMDSEDALIVGFVLFEDCAFLWHDRQVAVDPVFVSADGTILPPPDSSLIKVIENSLDEIEAIPADYLMCRPGWVREAVLFYATEGRFPDDITWRPAPLLQSTGAELPLSLESAQFLHYLHHTTKE